MKKSLLSITVLMLFLFCTMTVINAQTTPQVKVFDVKPDGKLILESDLGTIDVKTASLDKVDIVVTKEAEQLEGGLQKARKSEEAFTDIDVAEALADFEITFEQKETDVHIKGKFKRGREYWEKKQGLLALLTIRYEVTIPYQYNVNLTTSREDIAVTDLAGGLRAQTSVGNLYFGEVKGPVWGRTSSNGGITLAGCKSDVDVKTSVGDVNLNNITESVTAIGGDVQIINVGGGVIAQASSSGSIMVKDCRNNIDIKAAVGNIDLTNITGTVKASTGSNGSITVKDCESNVDVKASVGDIDLTNITGTVKASTGSSGNITLKGCESDVDVKTSVGDVNLSNITGSVTAIGDDIQIINVGGGVIAQASSSGSITVKDCESNVDAKASVGNIDLTNITGTVKASTGSSGSITVTGCRNNIDVKASVGNIDLTNITGTVKASTGSSGNITLKGCESDVGVKTSVGDVNLSNITGSVTAIGGDIQIISVGGGVIAQASSSGSITVTDCRNNIDVKASVGNIDLVNITGAVKAKTGSNGNITLNSCQGGVDVLTSVGNIRAEITKQPRHESTLQTSGGGGIVVTLISQIALNIDAQTSRGKVSSDLPIQVSKLSQNSLTGTINGGGPLLKLRTSSGDIRLEKR